MDTLVQDIRFGWRQLRRTPAFTLAAVFALTTGIGATTAIFTVLDRVVLRPLLARGPGDPAQLLAAVRTAVQRLDPDLPLSSARTLDRIIGDATDRPRALMLLMGIFAALALALSALGIYSVLSYSVNQRRQELSVRLALGAQPRDVLWLVIKQGLSFAVMGAAAGAAGALAIGRALSSLLYGVSSGDAAAFSAAIGVAVVTAVAACVLTARRAAALDPLSGLRAE
jgi:putative ABC transport system permease protein